MTRSRDVDGLPEPNPAAVEIDVDRYASSRISAGRDFVAAEEPLEIQIGSVSLAVVMRTPGCDEELVRGLLVSERVVSDPGDVESVRHCPRVAHEDAEDNVIRVRLRSGLRVDFDRLRRNLFASASCGVCGKATIEHAMDVAPPLDDPSRFSLEFFRGLDASLSRAQEGFALTGGLHAAGLFGPDGRLLVVREDVGRHNAVDKVIGWAVREGRLPLAGHVLMVSGRISYEIVQKALAARLPVIAAISAPSSLAVSLARAAGMTLVGFLRGSRLNVYGARERVAGAGVDCSGPVNDP